MSLLFGENMLYYKSNYFYINKSNEKGDIMEKEVLIPENHTATEFLRGQASRIFESVAKNDNVVMVNKNSKPQNVIISYDRYCRLKEDGADI